MENNEDMSQEDNLLNFPNEILEAKIPHCIQGDYRTEVMKQKLLNYKISDMFTNWKTILEKIKTTDKTLRRFEDDTIDNLKSFKCTMYKSTSKNRNQDENDAREHQFALSVNEIKQSLINLIKEDKAYDLETEKIRLQNSYSTQGIAMQLWKTIKTYTTTVDEEHFNILLEAMTEFHYRQIHYTNSLETKQLKINEKKKLRDELENEAKEEVIEGKRTTNEIIMEMLSKQKKELSKEFNDTLNNFMKQNKNSNNKASNKKKVQFKTSKKKGNNTNNTTTKCRVCQRNFSTKELAREHYLSVHKTKNDKAVSTANKKKKKKTSLKRKSTMINGGKTTKKKN
jgi:hypothetical protein